MQRIGLYGGSFDPVHTGHLLVGQAAREELKLDRLYFIPTAQSPFKPVGATASAEQRLTMLRLALAGNSEAEVDARELNRGGVSFTIDTVLEYATRFPGAQLCYLIGADNVAKLPEWKDAEKLARLAEFIVIPRPGASGATLPPPFHGQNLQGFPFGVSSSQVRARVKQGRTIHSLVPVSVAEYICNNQLYL